MGQNPSNPELFWQWIFEHKIDFFNHLGNPDQTGIFCGWFYHPEGHFPPSGSPQLDNWFGNIFDLDLILARPVTGTETYKCKIFFGTDTADACCGWPDPQICLFPLGLPLKFDRGKIDFLDLKSLPWAPILKHKSPSGSHNFQPRTPIFTGIIQGYKSCLHAKFHGAATSGSCFLKGEGDVKEALFLVIFSNLVKIQYFYSF